VHEDAIEHAGAIGRPSRSAAGRARWGRLGLAARWGRLRRRGALGMGQRGAGELVEDDGQVLVVGGQDGGVVGQVLLGAGPLAPLIAADTDQDRVNRLRTLYTVDRWTKQTGKIESRPPGSHLTS